MPMVPDRILPAYRASLRPMLVLVAVAAIGLGFTLNNDAGNSLVAGYSSWHLLLELLACIVAILTFVTGWHTFNLHRQRGLLLAACAFLGVGLLDLAHLLSSVSMPDYITANSVEKGILFWLSARYLAALALLLLACNLGPAPADSSPPPHGRLRYGLLAGVLLLVAGIHLLFLLIPDALPRTFIEGSGLTPFKRNAEYGVILLHGLSLLYLLPHLRRPSHPDPVLLIGILLLSALSELTFTFYSTTANVYNLYGHLLKVMTYLLLYRAIFLETVDAPYRALDMAHCQTRALLNAIPDVLLEVDLEGRYLAIHSQRSELLAAPEQQLIGRSVQEVLPADSAAQCMAALQEAQQRGYSTGRQAVIPLADGQPRLFELSVARMTALPPRFIVLSRDITERTQQQDTLRKLQMAVEQSPNTIVITDLKGNIEYVNPAFSRNTGYSREEAIGQNPRLLKSGKTPDGVHAELWQTLQRGQVWRGEFTNRRKNGTEYHESALISPILDEQGRPTHYLAVKEDITQRKLDQQRIERLAHFDALTGLPNRTLFRSRFEQAHGLARRNKQSLALLFLDLDHFKNINDSLGHRIGDLLLKAVAERLEPTLRREDSMSRQGGDEFMLLLPCSDARSATHVAERLRRLLARPFQIENHQLVISASIGIALFPEDGHNFDRLAQHADAAMYRAKQAGRNRYCFFTAEMQVHTSRMLTLENALRRALERNELHLHYQPQLSADGLRVTGVEALLRWNHPQLGAISPAEFIPLAESSGQITAIGRWVMQQACQQMRNWLDMGLLEGATMAVNLSLVQLRDTRLVEQIAQLLLQTGLPAACLELELTESVAMHDPQAATAVVRDLHYLGVRLAIDDFGTGYSSLSCLKQFEVHKLKIDQTFVRHITEDDNDQNIVAAIISMAATLGMQVIAEGVETREQLTSLRQLGCHEAQGYLFSHPRPPTELEGWLRQRQQHPQPA